MTATLHAVLEMEPGLTMHSLRTFTSVPISEEAFEVIMGQVLGRLEPHGLH